MSNELPSPEQLVSAVEGGHVDEMHEWVRATVMARISGRLVDRETIDYEAAKQCPTCRGSGVVPEDHHFQGLVEMLGCPDCRGTGEWLNDEAVHILVDAALGVDDEQ